MRNINSNEVTDFEDWESPQLDHVAILVPNVEKAARAAKSLGFEIQKLENFVDEGTREIYVGEQCRPARLLFMEAIAEGPYMRALKKRGPGLHHLGFTTLHKQYFCRLLIDEKWNLLKDFGAHTFWYFQKGCPLLEIHQRESKRTHSMPPVVEALHLPFSLPGVSGEIFKLESKITLQINGKLYASDSFF